MDVESLAKQLILKNMTPEQQNAVLDSIRESVMQAKDAQKQRIGENVQVVVQALKKLEADIKARYDETGKAIEKRVATIKDGKDGRNGVDGKAGKDGRAGRDGATGPRGSDGLNGNDGRDGEDGISVTDAHIDFDGSLIIGLSSGRIINVGEVVAPDVAEKIKIIANGGGTSQTVIDALASLQTQINELIPSQTGNAGKFLTTDGTDVSWAEIVGGLDYQGTWNATTNTPTLASSVGVNGYYYVVATAGSTNLNGVTDWQIGDWAIYNGTAWQKIDQTNLVTSVAGRTGAVTLANTDISGLGTMSTQASSSVSITGGSITGITDLAIADGGTGQSTANAAFNALAPSQTSNANKYLKTDGTNTSWQVVPEPAAATPTDDGLVFGSTVSSTAINLQAFSNIVFYPITFYNNEFSLNFIDQSTWTAFVNTYLGVGLPLYVAHPSVVKYYGVVTSLTGGVFVSNPEGHDAFFSTYDGQNTTFSSPGIVGGGNVSLGYTSNNNNGAQNTVIGYGSGSTITTGSNLTIVGYDSEPTSATTQNEATFGNSTTTKTRLFGALAMGGTSVGTSGQVLTSAGAGTAPTWTTPASGSVTSVTGTSPVVSSGGTTPAISLASGYGDTLNPYASKTANYVLAAPNGSAGVPTFRAIVAADIPTLNQNTTGNAATATNVDYSGLTGTVPTWNQNTTGTAANVTGVVAIANGGSGQTTAQLAINAFAGAVTSGSYLRGDGTNVVMNTIQVADVPTLNQNTTGTSANVTGVVAIANGGTGQTTATTAFNALAPVQTANSGKYLTTDGTNSSWATVVSGATVANDTSTTTNLYPLFANATSGTPTTIYTGNTYLLYKPSTGELQARVPVASNGIVVNSQTVSTSYTIASGFAGASVGPITVSGGAVVTVGAGSRWVVS